MENIKKVFGDKITYVENAYEAVKDASVLCVLTDWNEFKQADLNKVKSLMKHPVIIDGRNIYQPESMKKLGVTYISTGRRSVS
jgi:UDPglucose 6-dehydrogenase